MAAIVADERFDLETFVGHLSRSLPIYAIPVFVRLRETLDATETFKQKNQQLIREGFDPAIVGDPLLVRDPESGDYRRLDAEVYADIVSGAIRL